MPGTAYIEIVVLDEDRGLGGAHRQRRRTELAGRDPSDGVVSLTVTRAADDPDRVRRPAARTGRSAAGWGPGCSIALLVALARDRRTETVETPTTSRTPPWRRSWRT